ncbi:MAG: hypothetical protein ACK4K0_06990 [Flavobacteriales bacterium]
MRDFLKLRLPLFLTVLISLSLLVFYYHAPLSNLNSTYFASGGDGLQSYYQAVYHTTHDTTYWHNTGMNYPHGEHLYFTNAHPLVSNLIKLIKPVVDLSNYTVGILNGIMLLSVVLSALFLFLLLKNLQINKWLCVIAAVGIAFASPQIMRLGGHFSLTYQFIIPASLYLLHKFWQNPTIKNSTYVFVLTTVAAFVQFYFLAFILLFATIFYLFWTTAEYRKNRSWKAARFLSGHFLFQFILPFIVVQSIAWVTDSATDRTTEPWGFFVYVATPSSVLYPFDLWCDFDFIKKAVNPSRDFEWEGLAYIGGIGLLSILFTISLMAKRVQEKKYLSILLPFENSFLNAALYAGCIALLIATAAPFYWFDKFLYYQVGYVKQLRGIGRFAWVTFYAANILGICLLNQFISSKNKTLLYTVFGLVGLIYFLDGYHLNRGTSGIINNRIAELEEKENHVDLRWLGEIKSDDYQAIIPLPYFHIGSENIWIQNDSEISKYAFIASMISGKSLTAVLLSRTPLSYMYENIRIIQEPYLYPEWVSTLNDKPYLVLIDKHYNQFSPQEESIISAAETIYESDNILAKLLPVSYFEERLVKRKLEIKELENQPYYTFTEGNYTDSLKTFVFLENENTTYLKNHSTIKPTTISVKGFPRIYTGKLPAEKDSVNYNFSFWVENFTEDIIPRTTLEILLFENDSLVYSEYIHLRLMLITTDGRAGLVEHKIRGYKKGRNIQLAIMNDDASKKTMLTWSRFLALPEGETIWHKNQENWMVNNRFYEFNQAVKQQ